MNQAPEILIAELLRRTGAAHGHSEPHDLNGVYDLNWAPWYADWALRHGLSELLGRLPDAGALSLLLAAADQESGRDAQGLAWPESSARRLVQRHSVPRAEPYFREVSVDAALTLAPVNTPARPWLDA